MGVVLDVKEITVVTTVARMTRSGMCREVRLIYLHVPVLLLHIAENLVNMGQNWAGMFYSFESSSTLDADAYCADLSADDNVADPTMTASYL